jgi:hypothetical protein
MFENCQLIESGPALAKKLLNLTLRAIVLVVIMTLLNPGLSGANGGTLELKPTEEFLKPQGTAESNVTIWFPKNSVDVPVLATADYLLADGLPEGISYPPDVVGQVLTFGLWGGEGSTLQQFDPSIVINVTYEDSDLLLSAGDEEEEKLHLYMYNPGTQSWLKLCSSVNIYENVVSAALARATPFEENGRSLLAIAIDPTPSLDQAVNDQGTTTLSLSGSNLGFQVLVDTVEVGSHFAVSLLSAGIDSGSIKLLSQPVDIKGCYIDHDLPFQKNRQLTGYDKPLQVGFSYDPDTLSRAGGAANLTIVNLQEFGWVDTEEIGSRVERNEEAITVHTTDLGTFGMAVR